MDKFKEIIEAQKLSGTELLSLAIEELEERIAPEAETVVGLGLGLPKKPKR